MTRIAVDGTKCNRKGDKGREHVLVILISINYLRVTLVHCDNNGRKEIIRYYLKRLSLNVTLGLIPKRE